MPSPERQLTARAVATGMIVGAILSVSNVYVGLKIGWSFGVSISATVIAFTIGRGLDRLRPTRAPVTLLENAMVQTCAGAAGYMAASGLNSAIPALDMLRARGRVAIAPLSAAQLVVWICAISVLGVLSAAWLRRRFVVEEALRFPTGSACAEALRSMHASDAFALGRAKLLAACGAFAAALKLLVDAQLIARVWPRVVVPARLGLPLRVGRFSLGNFSVGMPVSVLLLGAGGLVGLRVAATLAVTALVSYAALGPWLVHAGVLRVFDGAAGSDAWKAFAAAAAHDHAIAVDSPARLGGALRASFGVWPGTAALVSASLVSLAMRAKVVPRSFASIGTALRERGGARASDELSTRVHLAAFVAVAAACVALERAFFGIALVPAILAVLAAIALGAVAARATGETDIAPVGPLGKLAQLVFALIAPANPTANLMTANVTTGAAAHASELLTDLKTGHLVGASPKKQLVAQLFGIVAGSFVCVPAYLVLSRSFELGSSALPAPAAMSWRAVAELLAGDAHGLPRYAAAASIVAAVVAGGLAVAEELLPRARPYLPSATAIGIAFVIDAQDSLAIFAGALLTYLLARRAPAWHASYAPTCFSGLIAGEALMGVGVAILKAARVL